MSTDKLVSKSDLQNFYNRILPYLGGTAEAGFTPVGTVISVMGKTAPANYLPCDGRVVNISDYPELADYFKEQFGSSNYFGGDGTTTFGIVDLSGEFLRGTGTNSHTNQGSGGEVGEHQNGTQHTYIYAAGNEQASLYWSNNASSSAGINGTADYLGTKGTKYNDVKRSETGTSALASYYTSRPTNTSVLFCIATKNIYLNPSLDFSTSEKVVGTWIGKPLYQKTCNYTFTNGTQITNQLAINLPSGASIKNISTGMFKYVSNSNTYYCLIPATFIGGETSRDNWSLAFSNISLANIAFQCGSAWKVSSYTNIEITFTIQYTKTSD